MSPHRLAAFVSIVAVGAAVAAGLYLSGSPAEQRLLRFDEHRIADLRSIAAALNRYIVEADRLPAVLDELVDGRRLIRLPRDPETDEPYEYEITGERSFLLCAEFSRESPPEMSRDFFKHEAGRTCFPFDYSDLRSLGQDLR